MKYHAKQLLLVTLKFINVGHILAVRYQQLQCYYHIDSESLGGAKLEMGPGEYKLEKNLGSYSQVDKCTSV